jgi:hypothetical protein
MRIIEHVTFSMPDAHLRINESEAAIDAPKVIFPEIRAITANKVTRNKTYYPIASLVGDPSVGTGIKSFTDAFGLGRGVPIIKDHMLRPGMFGGESSPIYGRVIHADFVNQGSGGYLRIIPSITDKDAIEAILSERFLTVSIGVECDSVLCSICGSNLAEEGLCEHNKGESYEGIECYWMMGPVKGQEVSFVGAPSDTDAGVINPNMTADKLKMFLNNDVAEKYLSIVNGSKESEEDFFKLSKEEVSYLEEYFVEGALGYKQLPLEDRKRPWDATGARRRVKAWSGSKETPNSKYKSAFFWYNSAEGDNYGSYKLPYADIIDGKLTAIPRGIFAVAQRLESTDIPASDKASIRRTLTKWYSRMRSEFKDDSLRAPWEKETTPDNDNKNISEEENYSMTEIIKDGSSEEVLESLNNFADYKESDAKQVRLDLIRHGIDLKLNEGEQKESFLEAIGKSAGATTKDMARLLATGFIIEALEKTESDKSEEDLQNEEKEDVSSKESETKVSDELPQDEPKEESKDAEDKAKTDSESLKSKFEDEINSLKEDHKLEIKVLEDKCVQVTSELHSELVRTAAILNFCNKSARSEGQSITDLMESLSQRSSVSLKDSIEDQFLEFFKKNVSILPKNKIEAPVEKLEDPTLTEDNSKSTEEIIEESKTGLTELTEQEETIIRIYGLDKEHLKDKISQARKKLFK